MRKSINASKRMVSFALAAAMIATTAFGGSVSASAASKQYVKSLSLSKKAVTVNVNASQKVKATVKVAGKASSKIKAATSKKDAKIVTVSVKGKNITIKGKKAGKAVVKVTTAAKKKNGKKATASIKVTVKKGSNKAVTTQASATTQKPVVTTQAPATTQKPAVTTQAPATGKVVGVKLDEANAKSVEVNKTIKLAYHVLTEGEADKSVSWTSSDSKVATVNANGEVTGVTEGKATITVTTKSGNYQDKVEITVTNKTIAQVENGVSLNVTNAVTQFSSKGDYMLFTGSKAEVQARFTDEKGQPIGNKGVSLSLDAKAGNDADLYKIDGEQQVKTTDADGYVTFYVVPTNDKITPTSFAYESYWVTAEVVGDTTKKVGASLSFGCVYLKNDKGNALYVANQSDQNLNTIEPGENAYEAGDHTGVAATDAKNGSYDVSYVSSQQVSNTDKKVDHSVYFGMDPVVKIPAKATKDEKGKYKEDINFKSGVYSVYNDEENASTTYTVKTIPAGLEWATIHFNADTVNLSKYTKLSVKFFNKETDSLIKEQVITNTSVPENGEFGVQIPIQKDQDIYAVVSLISEGQIDENNNKGYTLGYIDGEFKSTGRVSALERNIDDTVKWDTDSRFVMSDQKELQNPSSYLKEVTKGYTYTYAVPSFPSVGNAIIYGKDENGVIQEYYTYPSKNMYKSGEVQNENDIIPAKTGLKATKISKQEATNRVGSAQMKTVNKKAYYKIDSITSGYTAVKATVDLQSKYSIKITNPEAYTSVYWAPYYNREIIDAQDFYALYGQSVKVTAQLYDSADDNPVSQIGKYIEFSADDGYKLADFVQNYSKDQFMTDKDGRCTFEVSSTTVLRYLQGLKAKSEGYNVRFTIGGKEVTNANIHWIDAGLYFKDQADTAAATGNAVTAYDGAAKEVALGSRQTASKWTFGMKVVGKLPEVDTAKSWKVSKISGVKVNYLKSDSAEDITKEAATTDTTYTLEANGIGTTKLTGSLDSSSVTDNVTFTIIEERTVTDEKGNAKIEKVLVGTYRNVGEGSSQINATIPLSVEWTNNGMEAGVVSPLGDTLDITTATTVYIQAIDKSGNKVPNADVKYSISSKELTDMQVDAKEAKTDKNGLVAIKLAAPGKTGNITISGSVAGNEFAPYKIAYTNSKQTEAFAVKEATLKNDNGTYVVNVKFNANVKKSAISALTTKGFALKNGNNKYEIKEVKTTADADTVQIVLANDTIKDVDPAKVTLTIASVEIGGITYQISDQYNRILAKDPTTITLK